MQCCCCVCKEQFHSPRDLKFPKNQFGKEPSGQNSEASESSESSEFFSNFFASDFLILT